MISERSPSEEGISMAWSMVKGTSETRPHLFQWYSLCHRGLRRLSSGTPRAPAGVDGRGRGRLYHGVFCGGPGQSSLAVSWALGPSRPGA
jgi:hypothetical protein